MNCKQCRRLIEAYHDGELDEKTTLEMGRHIAECKTCAAELDILKSEYALFERYRLSRQSEMADSAPKWEAVRQGIARRPVAAQSSGRDSSASGLGWLHKFTGSSLIRQAAFATLLVCLSVAGTLMIVHRNQPQPSAPVPMAQVPQETNRQIAPVPADNHSTGLESAMRAVRRAEQEYIQAIELLGEIVDRRKPNLDPQLVREMERNLKAIDASIEATRKAYYERPSDPELAQFMLAAYSKKVELLQELVT